MMDRPDPDSLPDDLPQDGIYGLWLRVTTDAVIHLLKYRSNIARDFLFDPDNPFFQLVCDELGYDPAALRERIIMAVKGGSFNLGDPEKRQKEPMPFGGG